MNKNPGTANRPLRVAIIGAGPSGFYAAGALLQQKDVHVSVDFFDRLPAPYGLVRYGVAPDHAKIKSVTRVYEKTALDPRVRFFGNITFGTDLSHEDVRKYYDYVIYAVGAETDRRLGIPGEDLYNSFSATAFVGWYNGHPDYVNLDFDLSQAGVAVIGVGNVAMDVARILAKSVEELKHTDITDYALDTLQQSRVKDIYVLARRGPVQAKFTNPEIREFGELEIADPVVNPAELVLDPASAAELENDRIAAKNVEILREFAERGTSGKPRHVHFRFLVSPVEIFGENGRVVGIRLERTGLRPTESGDLQSYGVGEFETLPVGLVLRSIGYKGVPLSGVPYDPRRGTIPNEKGRVINPETGRQVLGEYVVGWAKRGPTGVIGTNKPDAVETVEMMMEDLPATPPVDDAHADPTAIEALLQERGLGYLSFNDWGRLDRIEIERGKPLGRPRVKFIHTQEMLEALGRTSDAVPEAGRRSARRPSMVAMPAGNTGD